MMIFAILDSITNCYTKTNLINSADAFYVVSNKLNTLSI